MALRIKRAADARVIKAILHRVADIPGGVTIKVADLGGTVLREGTPIGPIANSLWGVVKTAKVVTEAADDATAVEIEKGSHFKVGDYFGVEGTAAKQITAIDKTTNADKDVITLASTLGVALAVNDVVRQGASTGTAALITAKAIVGSNYDVEASENLFTDAWLMAVVKEANTVPYDAAIKTALKGVILL